MADEISYEYKTVRAVRGTDGSTISKMRADGWELVDQTPGLLRSTLTFRRPKKRESWLLAGAGIGVLAVIAAVGGVIAVFSDDDQPVEQTPPPAAAVTSRPASASAAPAVSQSAVAAGTKVITARNDPEFAALLKAPDYCDQANLDFATSHQGQSIAFSGSIADMAPYRDYQTRFDILLRPGDKGPETTVGPAFKYENVNLRDLNLIGKKIPTKVSEGDTFRFVAKVREFNTTQCLFYLDPVSTQTR